MKFRFVLENLETGEKTNCKTLKDVASILQVDYHQARSVLLSDDKLFLHPNIKALCQKYKVYKNTN
jgi:hypothetical protein